MRGFAVRPTALWWFFRGLPGLVLTTCSWSWVGALCTSCCSSFGCGMVGGGVPFSGNCSALACVGSGCALLRRSSWKYSATCLRISAIVFSITTFGLTWADMDEPSVHGPKLLSGACLR